MNKQETGYKSRVNYLPRDEKYKDILLLWILRILAQPLARNGYESLPIHYHLVASYIGCDLEWKLENKGAWDTWINKALELQENKSISRSGNLFINIRKLASVLNLTLAEQQVLGFRALYNSSEALAYTLRSHALSLSDESLAGLMAIALSRSLMDISSALSSNGALVKSGLISIDQGNVQFREKLVAQPGLLNVIFREHQTIDDLTKFAIQRAAPTVLSSEDFPHCEADLHLLKPYLVNVKQKGLVGVNVLLHGKPGVGKTELVRLIAQEIGMTVYEVGMTTDAGFAMGPKSRYGAYLFNQRYFTTNPRALILFDEIEDVIQNVSQMTGIDSALGYDKAWVNRLLESNPVPTFWIANRIERMDPAYLRRFDYVIEMHTPPRSVRRRILDRYLEGLPVSEPWLERQAESNKFAPASIEKAARVIRHAGLTEQIDIEQNFERILRNSAQAQDGKSPARYPDSIQYRLEYINTSIDLKTLPTSLQKVHKGRILLHGAPGTGKTAYAHYLAKELDRPLITRRASDLQSMWLGEAEKNIAKMFRDASHDDAVLLLDEADTFLQDRQHAKHSWEISQINELLTQMECYEGIFLCATNFMDHLDVASLRRFGLKVRFDYLTAEQRYDIFEMLNSDVADQPMDDLASAKARKILATLSNLTPGDFSAVRQRCGMLGESIKTVDLLNALKEESVIKPDGQKRTIGFIDQHI